MNTQTSKLTNEGPVISSTEKQSLAFSLLLFVFVVKLVHYAV